MAEESIATYLKDAKPIIHQFRQDRKILNDLKKRINEFRTEARLFDDSINIYHCWQDGISRTLHCNYNLTELEKLHGIKGEITRDGDTFTIKIQDNYQISFIFCKHNIYTPLFENKSTNQCLRC